MDKDLKETVFNDLKSGLAHGILVSNLAVLLAREMECDPALCYELAVAGFLHDIGKLELSPYLYGRNTEGLSIEGMKYMRMHSKLSYEILEKYELSEQVLGTILHHHEAYDGSGYPNNLTGEEIPLGARILRVADEFAALISDRPYRKAFDIDTAVDIMIEEIKNIDMKVFITFQRLIHEESTLRLIEESKINLDEMLDIKDFE